MTLSRGELYIESDLLGLRELRFLWDEKNVGG